jgi:hypothetical protein
MSAHFGKPELEELQTIQKPQKVDSPLFKLFFRKKAALQESDPNVNMQSLDQYLQHRESRKMSKRRINEVIPTTQTLGKYKFSIYSYISLVELVRSKWEKSADKLPIHSDLPRLLKRIEIVNSEGEKIVAKHDAKKPYVVSKKILRNFLETLAIELGDTRDILPNIIQHFGHSSPYEEEEDADLSVEVRLFIKSYMKEESPTLR